MTLKIDLNNPQILRGYLDQALPQMGITEEASRIVIGSTGV